MPPTLHGDMAPHFTWSEFDFPSAALDYTTTYTGDSTSGKYIRVSFDTTANRYRMNFACPVRQS